MNAGTLFKCLSSTPLLIPDPTAEERALYEKTFFYPVPLKLYLKRRKKAMAAKEMPVTS